MGTDATHFQLDAASVRYGNTGALDRVSISIGAGERVAIVGPSGGGKTRMGGCLASIVPSDKKKIHGMRDAILVPVVCG